MKGKIRTRAPQVSQSGPKMKVQRVKLEKKYEDGRVEMKEWDYAGADNRRKQ